MPATAPGRARPAPPAPGPRSAPGRAGWGGRASGARGRAASGGTPRPRRRQARHRPLERARELAAREALLGALHRRGRVERGAGALVTPARAQAVQAQVAGDAVDPGAEAAALEGHLAAAEHAEEGVVKD